MKNAFIVSIVSFLLPLFSFGQEEFEERLSELIDQLEEKKFFCKIWRMNLSR